MPSLPETIRLDGFFWIMFSFTTFICHVGGRLLRKARLSSARTVSLLRQTHLDDQVSLGVAGHSAELSSQLLELRPAVCVDHPAWGREREIQSERRRG